MRGNSRGARRLAVLRFAVALVGVGSLCGCFELSQEVWVNPDLSGRVRWEVSVSDAMIASAQDGKVTPLGSLPESFQQARRDLEALPYVSTCRFTVLRGNNVERYVLDAAIMDFRALDAAFGAVFQGTGLTDAATATADGTNPFGELRLEEQFGGKIVLVQSLTMEEDMSPSGMLGRHMADETGNAVLGNLLGKVVGTAMTKTVFLDQFCTVTFHTPTTASTNGERLDGKTTAQWKLPMADLVRGEPSMRELRASFWLGTPLWMWVPVIVLGVAAVGTGARTVVVTVSVRSTRRKHQSLTVECPHCGQHGEVSVAKAGAHLRCRHCGAKVDVPYVDPSWEPDERVAWPTGVASVLSGLAAAGLGVYLILPSALPPTLQPGADARETTADVRARLDGYRRGDYDSTWQDVQAAARAGESSAQFVVSLMYAEGRGAPQDAAESTRWLRVAGATGVDAIRALAGEGHAEAQYLLGGMYAGGYGIPSSPEQATASLRAAAEQGHVGAQTTLAELYAAGRGAPEDAEEAAELLRAAADQGDEHATGRLAETTEQRAADATTGREQKARDREQRKAERLKRAVQHEVDVLAETAVMNFEAYCREALIRLQNETRNDLIISQRTEITEVKRKNTVERIRTRQAEVHIQVSAAGSADEVNGLLNTFVTWLANRESRYREQIDLSLFAPIDPVEPGDAPAANR